MQVCTSLQTDNHASTPPLCFYRPDALPAAQPTASKHWTEKKQHYKNCLVTLDDVRNFPQVPFSLVQQQCITTRHSNSKIYQSVAYKQNLQIVFLFYSQPYTNKFVRIHSDSHSNPGNKPSKTVTKTQPSQSRQLHSNVICFVWRDVMLHGSLHYAHPANITH